MEEKHQNELKQIKTRHQSELESYHSDINDQEERLQDITEWMEQENDKVQQRNKLREQLDRLKGKHEHEMSGIKRDKGIQIDKLRKDML